MGTQAHWASSRYRWARLDPSDGERVGRWFHADTVSECQQDALSIPWVYIRVARRVGEGYEHHADYRYEQLPRGLVGSRWVKV